MVEDLDLETFISISPKEFGIYLFDIKKRKNLYSKELKINNHTHKNFRKIFFENRKIFF